MASELGKQLAGEFIGTYLLILTVGFNVLSGQSTWAVLSIASVLMVSIYALASVSGANFNPAVTLTLYLTKTDGFTDVTKVAAYMGVQILAGICAGFSYFAVFGKAINLTPGTHAEHGEFGAFGAGVIEILYTFVLCFVVMRGAVIAEKNNESFGMAIAFSVVAGGYAGGWISGGCFNPAVAIGLDVSSAHMGVKWCFLYTLFEFMGAGLAAGIHMFLEGDGSAMVKKCLSEFLGTYVLVATVGFNVLQGTPAAAALSIGASLMVMIYALGGVSGANFNPAVTTCLAITGKLDGADSMKWVAPYMASQIAGGLAGAFTYYSVVGAAVPLAPGKGFGWGAAGFAEVFYTFLLCFVVINVACLNEKDGKGVQLYLMTGGKSYQMYGLAIGFCIVVGGNAIGAVSGGSLNPAVSIALDTTGSIDKTGVYFMNSLVYSCFELIGAALAAGTFYMLHDEQFAKDGKQRLKKDDPEISYGSM